MKNVKKRLLYTLQSIVGGFLWFFVSYFIVFQNMAEEDVFRATIGNIVMIFLFLAINRVEIQISIRLSKKIKQKKPNFLSRYFDTYTKGASMKSGLYCFYIALLVCMALLGADPNFAPLSEMGDYFSSVRYGILILIAVDKFLEQVFKEIEKEEKLYADQQEDASDDSK